MVDKPPLTADEIIELAWCDKTSFDSILAQSGLAESDVIRLMRQNLKPSSFRMWRKRVTGRKAKHAHTQFKKQFEDDDDDQSRLV